MSCHIYDLLNIFLSSIQKSWKPFLLQRDREHTEVIQFAQKCNTHAFSLSIRIPRKYSLAVELSEREKVYVPTPQDGYMKNHLFLNTG